MKRATTSLWFFTLAVLGGLAEGRGDFAAYRQSVVGALPGTPTPFLETAPLTQLIQSSDGSNAQFSSVGETGQPFGPALRIAVKRATTPPWNIQLATAPNTTPVKKGDCLFVAFRARRAAASDDAHFFAAIQQVKTYDGLASFSASPGNAWTDYYLRAVADRDYPAGDIALVFHFGQRVQTLDIGGLIAVNVGPGVTPRQLPFTHLSYKGQEPDADWRRQALARIENIRKGDLVVRVEDADGRAVTNVEVRVRMLRHAYQFGTFIEDNILQDTDDGKKSRETVRRLFNRVTCPVYWSDWGWENPDQRRRYLELIRWAKANEFSTRGHCLIWPSWKWSPRRLNALKVSPLALRQEIDAHLKDVVATLRPFALDTYDVVNEPRDNHDVMDILGPDVVADWFRRVRALDPDPALGLNEFNIVAGGGRTDAALEQYLGLAHALQRADAPLGVIGVQCHMDENLTPPETVLAILDRLAALRLPIHATEFDISVDDEQTQGDYMRDFLIAFFSHPATESITQWGYWEGRHWIPKAALFDRNWRAKPNAKAYQEWVLHNWWTDETHAADVQGYSRIRAFLGDYEIVVQRPQSKPVFQRVHVTHDGVSVVLRTQ